MKTMCDIQNCDSDEKDLAAEWTADWIINKGLKPKYVILQWLVL